MINIIFFSLFSLGQPRFGFGGFLFLYFESTVLNNCLLKRPKRKTILNSTFLLFFKTVQYAYKIMLEHTSSYVMQILFLSSLFQTFQCPDTYMYNIHKVDTDVYLLFFLFMITLYLANSFYVSLVLALSSKSCDLT